jgi:hypothetical protein
VNPTAFSVRSNKYNPEILDDIFGFIDEVSLGLILDVRFGFLLDVSL